MPRYVLIVDDDETFGQALASALETIPELKTIVVRHGASAIRVARAAEYPIAALITDFHLPQIDGFEVIRQLKAIPAYANIPVLMITAAEAQACRNSYTVEGPNMVLQKPVSYREVRRVLETLLS